MNKELVLRYEKLYGKDNTRKLIEISKIIIKDTYIRVNISKTTNDEVEKFLKNNRVKFSKTFLPNCYKIEKSFFNLSSSIEHLRGDFYIQDIASQIPANCIDFEKLKKLQAPITILDMCASPGSKTTQIADLLQYHKIKYKIIALEPENKRLIKLINNIQRQNFSNIEIFNLKGQDVETNLKFDLILLDAPCSGNLAGDKDWLNKRDVKGILNNSKIQKELLKKAKSLLKKEGILIYSTCSLEVEENEENTKYALNNLGLKEEIISLKIPFETKPFGDFKSLRFSPQTSKTQGFYVSSLNPK